MIPLVNELTVNDVCRLHNTNSCQHVVWRLSERLCLGGIYNDDDDELNY